MSIPLLEHGGIKYDQRWSFKIAPTKQKSYETWEIRLENPHKYSFSTFLRDLDFIAPAIVNIAALGFAFLNLIRGAVMSLGDGILYSTILILLAAGIYQVTTFKKWKLVGKVFAVLVLIGVVVAAGFWGWIRYQDRPQISTELAGIQLGMSQLDVRLVLGEPDENLPPNPFLDLIPDSPPYESSWYYVPKFDGGRTLLISFVGDSAENSTASFICQRYGSGVVAGVSRFYSEQMIIDKLGEPTHISIHYKGTSKYISYEQWKAAFEIEQKRVRKICVTESGKVTYDIEYSDLSDPE